ncbi:MAG: serine/threonine-protein kinase, partial [Planctomycetota bacterium]
MTPADRASQADWSKAFSLLRELEALEGDALRREIVRRCAGNESLHRAILALLEEHNDTATGIDTEIDQQLGLGGTAQTDEVPSIEGIELTHLLGQGGSGDVYAGRQRTPDRAVAVKVLRSGLSSRRAVERFSREAQALAAISHESVARIHAVTQVRFGSGVVAPCLVMEYVEGETVRELAKPLPLADAALLASRIARGLHAAHQRGVVHRDLKPSNIILTPDGNPKIIDFGVAALSAAGDPAAMQTMTGELLGTLGYMSPEQLEGTGTIADVRIDVYAIGLLFYELVSGAPAVDFRSGSSATSLQTIMQGTLPALKSQGDADAVYRKATSLDLSRRYDSAAAFADDLDRLAEGRPVSAKPPSLRYTAWMFARRHPWTTGAASLAVALVVALSGLAAVGFIRASHERDAALLAEERAREASVFLRNMLSSPDPDADGPDVRVADLLDRAGKQITEQH